MNPFLQVLAFRIAPLCPRLALCLRRVHPYLARHISVEKGHVAAYLRELGYYLGPAAWPRYRLIQSFTSVDLTERPDWHGENAWALLNFLCVVLPPMQHCKRWTAEVDQYRGREIISTIFLWIQEDGPMKELKLLSHSRGDALPFIPYAARCCAPAGCCLECTHQDVKSQRVLKQPQFRWTWFLNQIRGCWQLDCEIQQDVLL